MGKKIEPYFGVCDLENIIGDKLSYAFIYEVGGTNQSFSDYTVSGIIFDKEGNTVTTLTTAKSTTTVTDDTITISAAPDDLPTDSGVYGYYVRRTLTADSTDVLTIVRGKLVMKKSTEF